MRNAAWSEYPTVTHSLGGALYVVVFSTLFPRCFPVGTVLAYNLQNSVAVSFYKYYVNISPNFCHFVSVQEKKNPQLANYIQVIPYVFGRNIFWPYVETLFLFFSISWFWALKKGTSEQNRIAKKSKGKYLLKIDITTRPHGAISIIILSCDFVFKIFIVVWQEHRRFLFVLSPCKIGTVFSFFSDGFVWFSVAVLFVWYITKCFSHTILDS